MKFHLSHSWDDKAKEFKKPREILLRSNNKKNVIYKLNLMGLFTDNAFKTKYNFQEFKREHHINNIHQEYRTG